MNRWSEALYFVFLLKFVSFYELHAVGMVVTANIQLLLSLKIVYTVKPQEAEKRL